MWKHVAKASLEISDCPTYNYVLFLIRSLSLFEHPTFWEKKPMKKVMTKKFNWKHMLRFPDKAAQISRLVISFYGSTFDGSRTIQQNTGTSISQNEFTKAIYYLFKP